MNHPDLNQQTFQSIDVALSTKLVYQDNKKTEHLIMKKINKYCLVLCIIIFETY